MIISYTVPEIWHMTNFILSYFCPFILLTAQKNQNLKIWKKCLEKSWCYTCVPKLMIRWCTASEICCMKDGQKWHIEVNAPPKKSKTSTNLNTVSNNLTSLSHNSLAYTMHRCYCHLLLIIIAVVNKKMLHVVTTNFHCQFIQKCNVFIFDIIYASKAQLVLYSNKKYTLWTYLACKGY